MALALLKQGPVCVMTAGYRRPGERQAGVTRLYRQYSSASMTVITRMVTAGSVGSGEWYLRSQSKILDLEKDRVAVGLERAKVVLFMGVVGVTKVVEHGDGLDDALDGLFAEGGDAGCHDGDATA